MFNIRTSGRGRLIAAPLGAVALVGLAACGTGADPATASSGGTPTSTSTGAQSTAENPTAENPTGGASDSRMTAFRTCLQQNGVTLPDRPAGARRRQDGTPPSGAPAPDGAGGQGGAGDHGGRTPGQAPPGVDAAKWAAARKACADLAPTRPDGGAAPSASAGT